MFSSLLQPLDETPAMLAPADCPQPWATTYPACQRCAVTRGARISHPFCAEPPISSAFFAHLSHRRCVLNEVWSVPPAAQFQ